MSKNAEKTPEKNSRNNQRAIQSHKVGGNSKKLINASSQNELLRIIKIILLTIVVTVAAIGIFGYLTGKPLEPPAPSTFDIIYELDGGVNNAANPTSFTAGVHLELKNPTKEGHTFDGWYTNLARSILFDGDISTIKGPLTLYAKWIEGEFFFSGGDMPIYVSGAFFLTDHSVCNIPQSFGGKKVIGISDSAFMDNDKIIWMILSSNTKYVGKNAFRNCSNLRHIYIPQSIESIGENAFKDCHPDLTLYFEGDSAPQDAPIDGINVEYNCIYRIDYNLNGGANDVNNPPAFSNAMLQQGLTLNDATIADNLKLFAGWYSDADFNNKVTQLQARSYTLYAKWEYKKFNLTLHGDNGKFTVNGKALSAGTPLAITYNDKVSIKAIANEFYKFEGWYNDSSHSEQASNSEAYPLFNMGDIDKVLYAKFVYDPKDNPMTVSFPDSIVYGEFFNHNISINNNRGGTPVIDFKFQDSANGPYFVAAPTEVGKYTLRVYTPASFGYKEKTITRPFEIVQAEYDISGISFTDEEHEYDGNPHTLFIKGDLPFGVSVGYTSNQLILTDVGETTVTASFILTDATNYKPIDPMTATLTITRREIVVTANEQEITYGDDSQIDYKDYSVDRLVNGELLQGELQVVWGENNSGTYKNAGTYNIAQGTVDNDNNSNYNITFVSDSLIINKRDITVTAVAESKAYDYDPDLNYTVDGLLDNSHKAGFTGLLALATTEVAPYPVGDYDIVIGTLAHPNYNINFEGAIFTVDRNNNVFEVSVDDYIYGTYAINTLPDIIFTDYYAGLPLTYTFSEKKDGDYGTPSSFIPWQVGEYKVEVFCAGDSNYHHYTADAEFKIEQATLTVTYTGDEITYGGTPDFKLTYSGWIFEDNIENITPPTFVNVPTNVGEHTIEASGGESRNYTFEFIAGTLKINKKSISVTANNQEITYGEQPDLTDYEVNGLEAGDTLTGALAIDWGIAGENNVGEHTIVQGSLDNTNYNITFTPGTLTITEYPITVTARNQEITYGELPDLTDYTVLGLLGDDKVEGNLKIDWGEDDVPSVGTYDIELGSVGNPNYTITFIEATLTVKQRDISGDNITITLSYDSIVYNGEVNKPKVTSVTVDLGNDALFTLLPTDYEVSYSNDSATGVGTYTVTITASSDNCTGSKSINYAIAARPILAGDISVADSELVYDNTEKEPTVTVTITRDGMNLTLYLDEDTDFTVAYNNNINAGSQAEAIINGAGNFSGTDIVVYFTIAPLDIENATITLDKDSYIYDGTAKEPEVIGATIDGLTITFNNVNYENNTNVGQATVTISGTGNFTGTASTNFEITPLSIEDNLALSISLPNEEDFDYVYNGEAKEPTPTVKLGETDLVLGTDYTVSYLNNIEIGTATVTITGKGNYKDTASKDFKILLTVTFVANGGEWADGSTEQKQYLVKGSTATAPADPANDTYEALLFTWDVNDYTNLTADLTVTAHWYTEGLIFTLIDSDTAYNVKALYMASFPEVVFIPALYCGKPVTKVPEWAFAYADMVSIIFAENSQLTAIGTIDEFMGAFFSCEALENIVLPKTIELIGAFTFSGCNSLAAIHIEKGGSTFATIDGVLFNYDYTELLLYPIAKIGDSYEIPASVTTIGEQAFNRCKLQTVTFAAGSNIETIDNTAFSQCASLAYIELPVGLKTIGQNAFQYCPSLESIVIPNSVTTLGKGVFITGMKLTIYTQFNSKPSGWNDTWNSNNRPVVWGCALDADGKVLSFNKTASNPSNTSGNTVYNPSFKDLIFEGWYTNADFSGIKYRNITSAPNGMLYARWVEDEADIRYLIYFDSYGGTAVDTIIATAGTTIVSPDEPTKDGHDFNYWYLDNAEVPYTFETMPADYITLTAHWTIHLFDVTFVLEGEDDITRQDVPWNTPADAPEWTKTNYTLGYSADFDSVKSNLTINCYWIYDSGDTELETLWSAMQDELFFNMWSDFFTDTKFESDYDGLGIKALLIKSIPQTDYMLFAMECAYGDITDISLALNSTLDFNFSKLFATNIIITNAYAFDYIIKDATITASYEGGLVYYTSNIEGNDVLLRHTGKTIAHFDIPDGVAIVNYGAFLDKTNLTSVDFPDSLTLVDDYAFAGCTSLQEVHLPAGCSIGYRAFYGCTSLEKVTVGGVPIAYSTNGGGGGGGNGPYPAQGLYFEQGGSGGSTPFAIGAFAFAGCTRLTTAKIPFGTNIGQSAFDQGTDLTMDDEQGDPLPTIYIDGVLYQLDCVGGTVLVDVLSTVSALTIPDLFTSIMLSAFEGIDLANVSNPADRADGDYKYFDNWYSSEDWFTCADNFDTLADSIGSGFGQLYAHWVTEIVEIDLATYGTGNQLYKAFNSAQNGALILIEEGDYYTGTVIQFAKTDVVIRGIGEVNIIKTAASDSNRQLFTASGRASASGALRIRLENITLNANDVISNGDKGNPQPAIALNILSATVVVKNVTTKNVLDGFSGIVINAYSPSPAPNGTAYPPAKLIAYGLKVEGCTTAVSIGASSIEDNESTATLIFDEACTFTLKGTDVAYPFPYGLDASGKSYVNGERVQYLFYEGVLYSYEVNDTGLTLNGAVAYSNFTLPIAFTAIDLSNLSNFALSFDNIGNPKKEGYDFAVWYVNADLNGDSYNNIADAIADEYAGLLYPSWTASKYDVTFAYDGGTGEDLPEAIEVTFDAEYGELPAPTRTGYTFAGWFDVATDGNEIKADTVVKTAEDHTLYAYWEAIEYGITYELYGGANDNNNPATYTVEGEFDLADATKEDYKFLGWFDAAEGGNEVTAIEKGTTGNKVFYARWQLEYIYFGEYPQTLKADGITVSATQDSRGYYIGSDGYYAKVIATPYENNYIFSTGGTVVGGTVYYFKVEPIRWRILSIEDGKALILCESIIANRQFYKDQELREIDGETIYPNNYEYSDIRAWLNNEFFNTAFSALQQALIQITEVDNSANSSNDGGSIYFCDNTFDKIFLPSVSEISNTNYGFPSSPGGTTEPSRYRKPSDYSRATGALMDMTPTYRYENGAWWLRSPSKSVEGLKGDISYKARYVKPEATTMHLQVQFSYGGVVPAMYIDLSLLEALNANTINIIAFNSNGGTEVDPIIKVAGAEITSPADPTKEDYTFEYWYLDNEAQPYDFPTTMPEGNIILNAKWERIPTILDQVWADNSAIFIELLTDMGGAVLADDIGGVGIAVIYAGDISNPMIIAIEFANEADCNDFINAEGYLTKHADYNIAIIEGSEGLLGAPFEVFMAGAVSIDSNGFFTYTDGDDIVLIYYNGTDADIEIPATITKIAAKAFYGNDTIESVTIPASVTEIGDTAFYDCANLTTVNILGTPVFGENVFLWTPGEGKVLTITMAGFTIVDGVLTEYTGAGGTIVIPNYVVGIAANVFIFNDGYDIITIPDSVLTVGVAAISNYSSNEIQINVPFADEEAMDTAWGIGGWYVGDNITIKYIGDY